MGKERKALQTYYPPVLLYDSTGFDGRSKSVIVVVGGGRHSRGCQRNGHSVSAVEACLCPYHDDDTSSTFLK
jgi:hypothetical protein